MKIATYNVRVDTDYDKQWSWFYRKEHVIDMIQYHDWDLFGVQEVRPNQIRDLQQLVAYDVLVAEREGDGQGEGLGIFYKKETFTMIDSGFFWLSETPEKRSIHPEAGCPRIALWGIFKEKHSEKIFLMINIHLDHLSAKARVEGLQIVLTELAPKIEHYPKIILGDFNAEHTEATHHLLVDFLEVKRDDHSVHYGPFGTFQDFDYERQWQDLEELDYIYTKDIFIKKTAVLTDSWNCRYPADHFPLVAEIFIK